ncbi:uracil-DNA glycosylase, partial [bacterium]|nr:uracil-DNA glycosylase [bacterium]
MSENFDFESINKILEATKEKCTQCNKCPLGKTRTKSVFSAGIPNNKIMLIGEAPGYWEDQKGEPFVGKAGQLLDRIFESVGLSRQKDIYICNTIKCRPPDN